ncbi:HEAT repeat domain-containing protein [Mesonia oceanica]|uniref:Uncharacterized protein n=1 Tax=Mesonia oceanica TaxID=2687242 RepID=A0AC61Y9Q8_9FLAO|nr:HEAT repeat domain-containing protein [Mesonia oceanica]MAQ39627.1 hypothetical protein [Mesonia sp.]MBJ98252.1 hypothetical protein [Flavobacteriaceae bacterium]MBJ98784.1 hypothetical protein [Flavobacteriaceae bacterium]VVV00868.1 hypothetical protein FVB9532_02144 [Mesonia oceanica]
MNKLTNYKTEKIFERLLTNKSKENYWKYISELRKRKTDEIFKKSILLTKSESAKERMIGTDVLAQFGFPRRHKKEIINLFFQLLKSESYKKVISSIFYGIGHNNEKLTNRQVEFLCSFCTHKSVYVKHSLVSALSSIEKDKAIDTLIKLSNDRDPDIRDGATFGIGSQVKIDHKKIRSALWDRISDNDQGTRFEAISGLARRKDHRIKEILKTELEKLDEYGSLILESIEYLNDKSFVPILEKKIQENKQSKRVNQNWLLNTLDKLNRKEKPTHSNL